jgi:acyl-CoA thioester hydrolase
MIRYHNSEGFKNLGKIMAETTKLDSHRAAGAIEKLAYPAVEENWFEYPIVVYPQHTDYSGAAWHGAYIGWLEEARVHSLRSIGIDFADLVAAGCDLPVVEMALRHHRSLRMGERAIVKARMQNLDSIRIKWEYEIQSVDREILYLTGTVTLVPVDREKGKIMRQLPTSVREALVRLVK